MFRITPIIIFFFVAVSANAADYSKCAEFFNNNDSEEGNEKGYRIKKSGSFVPWRLRYIPFHLKADGNIAVHKGATIEEEIDRYGRVGKQTITYQSPDIVSLETLYPEKFGPETKPVKVVIERNSEGDITAITENIGLITEEEESDEFERIKNWADGDAELAFAYKGTRTTFTVRAEECVPLESEELIVRYKDGRKQKTKIQVFDTKLCRKIEDFTDENYSVRRAYDKNLNGKIAELLAEPARELEDTEKTFLSDSKVYELINRTSRSSFLIGTLELQITAGSKISAEILPLRQKKFGISPLISAQMILADCRYQWLGPFIDDPRFWTEEDETPTD